MLVGGTADVDVIMSYIDDEQGMNLLNSYQKYAPGAKFIALTGNSTEAKAINCVGKAVGYFVEPLDIGRIVSLVVQRAERFKRGSWEVDLKTRRGFFKGTPFDLSHIRFLIYAELVKLGRVTYQHLADAIYHDQLDEEEARLRLKTNVQYLRQDLKEVCGEMVLTRYKQDIFWATE